MFLFLEFVSTIIILTGILILFGKILHKSKAFVTGLSIVLFVSSIFSGAVLYAIPMPTESLGVEATGDKNLNSDGNIIALKSVIVDGREYPIESSNEGIWFYSDDDEAYLWLNEDDERLIEPLTQEITLDVPVGAGRQLVFLSGEQYGIVRVSFNNESKLYDLYKEESTNRKISFTDSNSIYDDFLKLCRLGVFNLIILAILFLVIWLVEKIDKDSLIRIIYGVLSFIAALTFCINMNLTSRTGRDLFALICDFNKSFSGNFILPVILFPMLYKAFIYCGELYRKDFCSIKGTVCIALPASVFSVFMVMGAAFINGEDTLKPIFNNELQILKSLFAVIGYFSLFFFGIIWIYNFLDSIDIYNISNKKVFKLVKMYLDNLKMRPFKTTFFTLFIVYIPILIISYPGVLMGDLDTSMQQISGAVKFHNAQPITYTWFLGFCMRLGDLLFKSPNAGIFIHVVLQFLFSITLVSLMIKLFVTIKISGKIIAFLILYYSFHPRIQSLFMLLTKDIINAVFLLIFMVSLYMLLTQKFSASIYLLLGISDLGASLFRHDSSYVIVLSMIIIFFLMRDFRKQSVTILTCTLIFMGLWNSILLPAFNVLPTWERYLSDPENGDLFITFRIMQTARYIRDAGDEITKEENEIISSYLKYNHVVEKYQPTGTSDGVVKLRKYSSMTQSDVQKYHKVWLQMFAKHPEIYLEGILNFKYQYLYPAEASVQYPYSRSESYMVALNNHNYNWSEDGEGLSYPIQTANLRNKYESLRESFFSIPIFNILFTSSSFFWILIIWFSYSVYRNSAISISIMMPLVCQIGVLILGPGNGTYFRYTYPYVYCLPIVILLGLHSIKQQNFKN